MMMIPRIQFKRCLALALSEDEITSVLAKELRLDGQARGLWRSLTGDLPTCPLEELNPNSVTSRSIRNEEFEKWAALQWHGLGIRCFKADKISNSWLKNPWKKGLSEAEFTLALKARTRTFPSASHRTGCSLPRCRLCHNGPESLGHLTCACAALKAMRLERHNAICRLLLRVASSLGWTCRSEPKLAHMVDIAVCLESEESTLLDMEFFKRAKYLPFTSVAKDLDPSIRCVQVWGFPMGARGKWHKPNTNFLRKLGVPECKLEEKAKQFSMLALYGTLRTCKTFNRLVTGKTAAEDSSSSAGDGPGTPSKPIPFAWYLLNFGHHLPSCELWPGHVRGWCKASTPGHKVRVHPPSPFHPLGSPLVPAGPWMIITPLELWPGHVRGWCRAPTPGFKVRACPQAGPPPVQTFGSPVTSGLGRNTPWEL
ncbi:hypothetical protein WMY93_029824 [Mugilogobius chulae]|uniref:Reverse transcriptase zinc-binding domain-containing protein n=1 Tax=Mugilogobius chulae TaxID=88201 RepID=A0AAW0MM28_9GOBI